MTYPLGVNLRLCENQLTWCLFSKRQCESSGKSCSKLRATLQKDMSKHQPRGFRILHEDRDLIVGVKAAGLLTVSAKWEKEQTVHNLLNMYVRKGSAHSKKSVFVVHRLDQATSGVLVFAKSEEAQQFLKNNWAQFNKTYFAVVHGAPPQEHGVFESYLEEDEDYIVHSKTNSSTGKLAKTEYQVLAKNAKFSLLQVKLHTGRKNQIRVHMAELKCPIVGDQRYGRKDDKNRHMGLHAFRLELNHPFSKKRLIFEAAPPIYFQQWLEFDFKGLLTT